MPDFYVKSGGATERANSTAYVVGNRMVPLRADASTNNAIVKRWVWECTTAGTSGAAVPTWPATVTQDVTTVTDGTVVWTARKPGFSSGTTANWAFGHPYLDMMLSGTAAGDRIFVSHLHSEVVNTAGTVTATFPGTIAAPTYVYCVNDSQTNPTLMTLATTGQIGTVSGALGYALAGVAYLYGIVLAPGSAAADTVLTIGSSDQSHLFLDSCTLRMLNTGAGCRFTFGSTTASLESRIQLRNTTIRFSNASQFSILNQCRLEIEGGGIEAGGTAPSVLFSPNSIVHVTMTGFDLSGLASTTSLVAASTQAMGQIWLRYCRLPASWTGNLSAGTPSSDALDVRTIGCDSAGAVVQSRKNQRTGNIFTETVIKRTAGAAFTWRMASGADAEFPALPLSSPEIYFYRGTTGAAVTLSVEVVTDNVALNDQQAWVDVFALNTASQTQATLVSSRSTALLGTATSLASSTEPWTTTGLTTPLRQKMSVTFTPQVAGDFVAIVRLTRASTTLYVDPAITVT